MKGTYSTSFILLLQLLLLRFAAASSNVQSLLSSRTSRRRTRRGAHPQPQQHDIRASLPTSSLNAPASATTAPLVLPQQSIAQRLIAGGVSRALAQATLYPIDALRTLAQTRDGRTLKDVGTSALVRGCAQTSCFALFMGSIQFAVFGVCRSWGINTVVSSALGAAASCVVSVPQDVLKQRLVTGVYPSFRNAVATIYRTEGIPGFYSAWRPCMARNVPFVMTTFTTMELLKRQRSKRKKQGQEELNLLENMVIGMSSALVAGFVTQPVDVIKTRMMTQAASVAVPYTSALNCLVTIVRTEGVVTLYSGLRQRSTYMCLLWGMTFALNGQFKSSQMKKQKQEQAEL